MLAGLAAPAIAQKYDFTHDIAMRSDRDGAQVWFDPIGLWVEPGATIRWKLRENVHTATAYHPDNDNHALRIPKDAAPWDSSYLIDPGETYEVTLTVPGVYDYYCAPHEHGGMVGRIIVAKATGPGTLPFDYFKRQNPVPDWQEIPKTAQESFPDIEEIMSNGVVRI